MGTYVYNEECYPDNNLDRGDPQTAQKPINTKEENLRNDSNALMNIVNNPIQPICIRRNHSSDLAHAMFHARAS